MLTEATVGAARASYARDGFHIERGLLGRGELEALQEETRRVFSLLTELEEGPDPDAAALSRGLRELFTRDHPAFVNCLRLCQNLLTLNALASHPSIVETLRGLGLDFPVMCTRPLMFLHSPHLAESEGHFKTPTHQDWRSMQGSLDSVVVWAPVIDITPDLGPLEIIPGSHLRGLLPSVEDEWYRRLEESAFDEAEYEAVPMEAGDVLFFSAFLIHRSGENVSERVRWSIQFRYNNAAEETFVARHFPNPYVSRPQQDLITPNFPPVEAVQRTFDNL